MGSFLSSMLGGGGTAEGITEDELTANSRIIVVHSSHRWKQHLDESNQTPQLMVVDFAAKWCGPCRFAEPAVMELSNKCTDVKFLKIDVDELPDVAKECRVEAMPTFVLFKKGKEVDRVVGAHLDDLKNKITNYTAHA